MVLISRKNSQSGGRNRKLKRASQHNVINNNNGCQRSCSCHMPGAVLRGACASSHGALTATLEGWCIRACSVAQSCLTLCNPVDCSLPGSSVHGILQARILEGVAVSFSRGSSRPRDRMYISYPVLYTELYVTVPPLVDDAGTDSVGQCM